MAAGNALNINDAGYVVHDGSGIFYGRTFQAGVGISLTNADGIAGNTTISSTASLTDLHTARYIVASSTLGTGANYTSIAAAITAAQGSGVPSTIFIQPGTYTENLTITDGINLTAFTGDANSPTVTIIGKITMTTAGSVSISNIRLQTNSDFFLAVTGSAASNVYLIACYLNCSNNTGISFTSSSGSSGITVYNCSGNLGTTGIKLFANTSSGTTNMLFSIIFNTGLSTTASTITAGVLNLISCNFTFPITFSGTSGGTWDYAQIDTSNTNTTSVIAGGSSTQNFKWCSFISGSATALSVSTTAFLNLSEINSSNTNAISGVGTINISNVYYSNTSSTVNTTTQVPFVSSNDAMKIVTPAAYPYTTVPQGEVVLVDTSSARTIIPLASPTTGQRHIIKDSVGSAGANNITVTPSGKNIDGAASSTINVNYGSLEIVYSGSEWSII